MKVEFKVNGHGLIDSGESVYWVLKGVDLGNRVKAPKLNLDSGYEFYSWSANFREDNQIYEQNTNHYALTFKQIYYTSYSGDTVNYKISTEDIGIPNNNILWFCMVENLGEMGSINPSRDKGKDLIQLSDVNGEATIKMLDGKIYRPNTKKVEATFEIKVNDTYGDKILKNESKELKHRKYLFSQDIMGNKSWSGLNIKIKTQNTKGEVTPKEKETLRYVALTKEEIYEAVKNGEFVYNDGVPDKNKIGGNALHRVVEGKNLLDPSKVKEFNIRDEDYKKLDFSKLGDQEVPVTITYLDNSKSTVKVKIKIKENVPTGIIDDNNKQIPKILLFLGFVGVFVSAINFRKKFLKNYE